MPRSSPAHVIVAGGDTRGQALRSRLRTIEGVASVGPVVRSNDGRLVLVDAVLDADPESTAARDTYARIRGAVPDAVVGGATAFDLAVEHGVLVAVFQWGWLDWTGFESPGYIATIVPALVLAITVGLSMDYEVFLLARIRERYERHGDGQLAVAQGLVDSARVITSAALVMVAVFAAFAIAGPPTLRELGIGLAVAIGLDATLVRLVIVPATMRLLGDWNWWLPRPLARLAATPIAGGEAGSAASLER